MHYLRPFDKVKIKDPNKILNQIGGFDSDGVWTIISKQSDFLVLSRGARIINVETSGVVLESSFVDKLAEEEMLHDLKESENTEDGEEEV